MMKRIIKTLLGTVVIFNVSSSVRPSSWSRNAEREGAKGMGRESEMQTNIQAHRQGHS
jgi:hypothetical protein